MEVAISEFKAKCIEMLKVTAAGGEDLVVTLRGKPLARVVGVQERRRRVLGGQRGAVDSCLPDSVIMESDFAEDWEP